MTKILLVDDDIDVLEPNQYLLIEEGYKVISATNGNDAIRKFREESPDIVFMDIKMPGVDGYEAFYKIKEIDKDAKIVLTSAYAIDDEMYKKAKKSCLKGILTKPFGIVDMTKMIKKFVN